jgi:hypothetical protein
MHAGELTPIEKAERRVLALANPGHVPSSGDPCSDPSPRGSGTLTQRCMPDRT